MTTQEALKALETLTHKVTNKNVVLSLETDLKKDGILDSVDTLVFFLDLDVELGVSVPETADLAAEGYYSVAKLVALLEKSV